MLLTLKATSSKLMQARLMEREGFTVQHNVFAVWSKIFKALILSTAVSMALLTTISLAANETQTRRLVIGIAIAEKQPLRPKLDEYIKLIASKTDKNLSIELKTIPFVRLVKSLSSGSIDGDMGRLKSTYEEHSSVVMVPEPVGSVRLFFVFHKDLILKDLEAIRSHKTIAEIGNGIHRRACSELKLDCTFVPIGSSPLDMLRLRRVGSILTNQYQSEEHLMQNPAFKDFKISGKYYYSEPIYLFLTKSHADLISGFDRAVKEVKRNGEFKRIFGVEPP